MNTKIKQLFDLAVANKASDIHVTVGELPKIRVHGELITVTNLGTEEFMVTEEAMVSVLSENQFEIIKKERELDFSVDIGTARFRVNVYYQRGKLSGAFRVVPPEIPAMSDLGLPDIFGQLIGMKQGFVLVTGPTGHGKSTTVASVLNEINKNTACHIVTIEDPVEYVLEPKKALISQRELGNDSNSFQMSLRSCLRQDPNVVFVGEMRDLESIQLALTIAETGHLVFSTLHTNSAAQTMDRIVDVFPEGAREQIRVQLAAVTSAVISQRLIPTVEGKRVLAAEVMIGSGAVKNAIREGKNFMIDNIIQTSADMGMVTLDAALARLVKSGRVTSEVALSYSLRPTELQNYLRTIKA